MQRFGQQGGCIIATAAPQRGGATFAFAADKTLSDYQTFAQTRGQLKHCQFSQRRDVGFCATKTIVGAHHFTHVKPLRLHVAFTQDLDEQQGRHQFTVADQFVGQGG